MRTSLPAKPLAALALALAVAGCQGEAHPVAQLDRPVQVQRVAFARQQSSRDFVGVVRARYETDLGFRVAGKMVTRLVNVGDRVQAGDIVARLDPQDLKLQVESAEAELSAATSSLGQAAADEQRYATLKSRGFAAGAEFDRKKDARDAGLSPATSSLGQAAADEQRYATLKSRGFAAVAEFDRKKAARDEAEGRLERAKGALDRARNQLAYTDLRAGADGVIPATLAEPGQVVAVGQPVARLAHRGEKEAVVALPETWLAEARASRASVRLW